MKHRIIFATGNHGKMKEIRLILEDPEIEVISMKEAGVEMDIIEDGTSFAENAEIKARSIWNKTGGIVLADDSGLVVDFLHGEPGIYSARYMGENTSYQLKNQKILERMKEAHGEQRSARFLCDIAAVLSDGSVLHSEAAMEGLIAEQAVGEGGFGYDPLLYIPEFNATSAELTMEQKNLISHRGKALRDMKLKLKEILGGETR